MVFLGKIRKLFRRRISARRRRNYEDRHIERMLRNGNLRKNCFHLKYVGCGLVATPTLKPTRAVEVVDNIIRKGQRFNKWRVTLTIAPEGVTITDMVHQCRLAKHSLDDVGMVFTHPLKTEYVGVTVKDKDTSGYSFFVYKCTVSGFECENVEVKKTFDAACEQYLKIRHEVNCDQDNNTELSTHQESSEEMLPYYERLRTNAVPKLILNSSLLQPNNVPPTTFLGTELVCTCPKRGQDYTGLKTVSTVTAMNCSLHSKQLHPKRTAILNQLLECAPAMIEEPPLRHTSVPQHPTQESLNDEKVPSATTTVTTSSFVTTPAVTQTTATDSDIDSPLTMSLTSLTNPTATCPSVHGKFSPSFQPLSRTSSLPALNQMPLPYTTVFKHSLSCPNLRALFTKPSSTHGFEAVLFSSFNATATEQHTPCAMAMPILRESQPSSYEPPHLAGHMSAPCVVIKDDEEDITDDEAFSYLFTSSTSAVSPSHRFTPLLPFPTPAPLEEDEYVPLNRRTPPKKRLSAYIFSLIKQIDASLVESETEHETLSESAH